MANVRAEATRSRATRRKDVRAKAVARVLAEVSWLRDPLVCWTGRREEIPRLDGAPTPIRAVIQDRLVGLPAGTYAVRIEPYGLPSAQRLQLQVCGVDPVTPELVSRTARAIEAVSKFPKAATKFIGPVGPWCHEARRALADRRHAASTGCAWRIGAAEAAASPASLRDRLTECYEDERRIDVPTAPIPADERSALDLLLDAIDAVRHEPARRYLALGPSAGFIRHDLAAAPGFDSANPGRPADPAGAFAAVTIAGRLGRLAGPDAGARTCRAVATWLTACRPILPLAQFWSVALSVLSSDREPASGARARALVASLSTHAARLAVALAPSPDAALDDGADAARRSLPDVLARGPEATDRALRHALWLERADGLDAALRFVEAAERASGSGLGAPPVPLPRLVFASADPVLRKALLDLGLAIWSSGETDAPAVSFLLHLILEASGRPGCAPWRTTLPGLHLDARRLWRRVTGRQRRGPAGPTRDAPVLAFVVLDACARWAGEGFGDGPRLARLLADRWPSSAQAAAEWDPDQDDHNTLLVRLSEGRIPRLLALMRLPRAPRRHAWRGLDGYRVVAAHGTARAWISAALDRADLHPRVVRLLEHVGLLSKIDPGLRAARLLAALDRPAGAMPRLPAWVLTAQAAELAEIARAHAVATGRAEWPRALDRLLDRAATMNRERAALRAKAARTRLAPGEQARLDRLDGLASRPPARRAELRRSLDQALPKQRALAGLSALEVLVSGALDRRWQNAVGGDGAIPRGPAWDNALLMLESVAHNRRLLRRLIREAARGNHTWMRDLGPNRAFLCHLAVRGIDEEAWLAACSRTTQAPGGELTAWASTDVLEVLQMGSLFGTCLSADRFNAHAAVAAAVEVNKRVLFVRDAAGRVLGRQLIAITGDGEIVGFTCYGAGLDDARGTGQHVERALADLAREIARSCGARLMPAARVAGGLTPEQESALMLFCRGYVDTPVSFETPGSPEVAP